MKRICLMYNHFQLQDGVNRSAMAIANELVKRDDVEVTLIPIYKYDKECLPYVDKRVKIKPIFGFYFRGLTRFVHKIPAKWIYKIFVGNKYDVNIAFQYGLSEKVIASGTHRSHASIGWMHCFDEGMTQKCYYEKMDKMVCVSKCNAERLKTELPNVEVDYNYNPINDVSIREQGGQPIPIERPQGILFVSVARMSPEKGYETLLHCVTRLKKDGYKLNLWLIGDGPILNKLKNLSREFHIDDVVTFLGQQANPHAYVSKTDVYICSSETEGYSTTCTEAVMQGIPVLTTNCSGGEEIINDAECGLLFEKDEDSIYFAMKKVLDNPSLIDEWKQILQNTREHFSPQYRIKRFLRIVGLEE